jgi:hypothetical protein
LVGVVDCVLTWANGAAGGDAGGRSFGLKKRSSICCEINQTKTSEGAPEVGGGDRVEEETRGSPRASDLSRNGRWHLRPPMRDFASLAAQSAAERRGKGEGVEGYL